MKQFLLEEAACIYAKHYDALKQKQGSTDMPATVADQDAMTLARKALLEADV